MSSRGRGRGRKRWGDNGFEAWGGYMAAKKSKLEEQFLNDADKEPGSVGKQGGIFEGVAIFVNGYTDPSGDELKRIMMMNGGIYHHYFNSRKTTHMIATNLPDAKVKALKGNEPICSPKWIMDSLTEGKLLDYRNYLLYSNQSKNQPKLSFQVVPKNDQAKDASDSNFLGEFYNNSRLHHISSMGANFKRYVNELRENSNGDFPDRQELRMLSGEGGSTSSKKASQSVFMHIDMDCFFVSVGLRKRPELRGKAVAVAHAKGANPASRDVAALRKAEMNLYKGKKGTIDEEDITESDRIVFSSMSELASCSYEARAKGVKNGMFLGAALKLCPELKTIPYDFDGYQEVAYTLYDTVAKYTLDIQAVSCDEMLIDITEVLDDTSISATQFAEHLRKEIFDQTDCHASVGLGSSLLLARMATRKAKPNGCFHLLDEDAGEFIKSMPVRDLPGIGRKTGAKLREMAIETCEQMQQLSLQQMKQEFGAKNGEAFYRFCRGQDDRSISLCQERKSVSAEVNYGIRFSTPDECFRFLDQLSGEVQDRLAKLGVKGKSITLKLMVRASEAPKQTSKFMGHGVCDHQSRSSNLASGTNDVQIIRKEVRYLLNQLNVAHDDLRGIGIQVSKLEGNTTGTHDSRHVNGTTSIVKFMTTKKSENEPVVPSTSKVALDKMLGPEDLSFSQIDPDVLSSLPDEIKKEIEQACVKRKDIKCFDDSETPSPSSSKSLLDVTLSQVDSDYLAALPKDIAEELKRDLASKSQMNTRSAATTAFDRIMMQATKSPIKQTPPKPRRGRPPKNSPSFIKNSKKVQGNPKKLFEDETEQPPNKHDVIEEIIDYVDNDEEGVEVEEKPDIPNLNGLSELNDVRSLLREWLSTPKSTDDDIETVSKYFKELVQGEQLEQLVLLLKLMHRKCKNLDNHWQERYLQIEQNVQCDMKNTFGYFLCTKFD